MFDPWRIPDLDGFTYKPFARGLGELPSSDEDRTVCVHVMHCAEQISQYWLADCAERMVLALDDRHGSVRRRVT